MIKIKKVAYDKKGKSLSLSVFSSFSFEKLWEESEQKLNFEGRQLTF